MSLTCSSHPKNPAGKGKPFDDFIAKLSERLATQFTRIHRSRAVNHNMVAHIRCEPSGDGEVPLHSGQVLSLSRRYKEQLKQKLSI